MALTRKAFEHILGLAAQTGEAMSLGCQCRGEMALRHRACAIKWSRVKGDGNCDICKSSVRALLWTRTRGIDIR